MVNKGHDQDDITVSLDQYRDESWTVSEGQSESLFLVKEDSGRFRGVLGRVEGPSGREGKNRG